MNMSTGSAAAPSLGNHQDHCPKQSWSAPGVNTQHTYRETAPPIHFKFPPSAVLSVCTTRTASWKSSPTPVKSFSNIGFKQGIHITLWLYLYLSALSACVQKLTLLSYTKGVFIQSVTCSELPWDASLENKPREWWFELQRKRIKVRSNNISIALFLHHI